MKIKHCPLLLYLAKKSRFKPVKLSTSLIADALGVSQQTISRKLRDLEVEGMIERTLFPKGIIISITDKGKQTLNKTYLTLKSIFDKESPLLLKGEIVSGIGEGKYYVSLARYKKQLENKLGFIPYNGTLNLKVNRDELQEFLAGLDIVEITGFKTQKRTFGRLRCYPARFNSVNGAILIPVRSNQPQDITEFIAPINLRKNFGLKDGETITIKELQ